MKSEKIKKVRVFESVTFLVCGPSRGGRGGGVIGGRGGAQKGGEYLDYSRLKIGVMRSAT